MNHKCCANMFFVRKFFFSIFYLIKFVALSWDRCVPESVRACEIWAFIGRWPRRACVCASTCQPQRQIKIAKKKGTNFCEKIEKWNKANFAKRRNQSRSASQTELELLWALRWPLRMWKTRSQLPMPCDYTIRTWKELNIRLCLELFQGKKLLILTIFGHFGFWSYLKTVIFPKINSIKYFFYINH